MATEEEASWKEYIFGPMSNEEIAKLNTFAEAARKATAKAANNGDHTFDHLAPSFERIVIATEKVQQERTRGK